MGAQTGSKLPPWGQRVIRNSHITCNRTPSIYTFWMLSFSFWVFAVLNFTKKKQLLFWFMTLGPFWWVWGNNSNKQLQIELKSWPRGVLIVAQMPFKAFWKSQIFTETGRIQNLRFLSNFDPNLPPEDGQNQKKLFSYPDLSNSRPHLLSIFIENYNFLVRYFHFFGYKWAQSQRSRLG